MKTGILVLIIVLVIGLLWLARAILRFREFKGQLEYINSELRRASERSRPYWKKKRRKLWGHYLLHLSK